MAHDVHIIGGGLAGSEAAWQLARRDVRVRLSEMRGGGGSTPAHQTDGLAELVCSNSFRSDDDEKNAVGLLHHEMRRLDSLVMRAGEMARVPAGSAMAVDRDVFSGAVQRELEALPRLEIVRERIDALPDAGLADCGCFVISPQTVFPVLRRLRLAGLLRGRLSREENFLQALPFLAREASVVGVTGASPADTIGLNTAADLDRLSRVIDARRPTTD